MGSAQLEIQVIAALVALACAIPGTFLVLRKMAMISDAISHAILPGIVIGFFVTHNVSSPLLVLLAALAGVLTVTMVEMISKTALVKEDTAIGLVFPTLFSIGVILISRNASDVHIDTDAVLVGELAFAPFDRFSYDGVDLGPKALWVIGAILFVTLSLMILFFKELKISTFDPALAASLGFSPVVIHYSLMSVASVTTVGAFDAVGAVLVVALMIVPAASAYLLTDNLKKMLLIACGFGVFSAIAGYWVAHYLDASIAGSMATTLGFIFLQVYIFSPDKGLIASLLRQSRVRNDFTLLTFIIHLRNHSDAKDNPSERTIVHLAETLGWGKKRAESIFRIALNNKMITLDNGIINLTGKGRNFADELFTDIIDNKVATSDVGLKVNADLQS